MNLSARWQTILAVDFDKRAAATYRANFPGVDVRHAPVETIITELREGQADILLGGPPCQPFSMAGEGHGENDDRDGIPDFCAAIEALRPRMFVMENVAGLMTAKHQNYVGRIIARMEAPGYVVQVRKLDSVNFGVPQFRDRAWFWGIRRDLYVNGIRHRWPAPTHQWPAGGGMFDDLPTSITVGQALGLDGFLFKRPGRGFTERGGERRDIPTIEPSPAITANFATSGTGGLHYRAGRIDGASGYSGQRIISPHQPSPAITGNQNPEFIDIRIIGGGSNPRHSGDSRSHRDITEEPATTISIVGGNAIPEIHEYRWSDAMLAKHPPASPASPASPAPTVQAKYAKGGAEGLLLVDRPCPTISAGSHSGGPEPINNRRREGFVRRLTPMECMRLQSAPDDFLWCDGITKSAMYKICGNGQASLMVAHLSREMALADPDSHTVIDLFCGGGLGACGWHGRFWEYAAPLLPPPTRRPE